MRAIPPIISSSSSSSTRHASTPSSSSTRHASTPSSSSRHVSLASSSKSKIPTPIPTESVITRSPHALPPLPPPTTSAAVRRSAAAPAKEIVLATRTASIVPLSPTYTIEWKYRRSHGDHPCQLYTFVGAPAAEAATVGMLNRMVNMHVGSVTTTEGGRPHQEDRFLACMSSQPLNATLLAVFDGHGGHEVSDWLKANTARYVFGKLEESYKEMTMDWRKETLEQFVPRIHRVVCDAVLAMDVKLYQEGKPCSRCGDYHPTSECKNEERSHRNGNKYDKMGATCTFVLILGHHIFMCNLGDSRTILFDHTGYVYRETLDHKPEEAEERKRIEKSGGTVPEPRDGDCHRVNGRLALSRAIGDFKEKHRKQEQYSPTDCAVLAQPEVISFPLDHMSVPKIPDGPFPVGRPYAPTPTDALGHRPIAPQHPGQQLPRQYYLLLGSDGLFDKLPKQREGGSIKLAHKALEYIDKYRGDIGLANQALVKYALDHSSRDNITCLLVQLYPQYHPFNVHFRTSSSFSSSSSAPSPATVLPSAAAALYGMPPPPPPPATSTTTIASQNIHPMGMMAAMHQPHHPPLSATAPAPHFYHHLSAPLPSPSYYPYGTTASYYPSSSYSPYPHPPSAPPTAQPPYYSHTPLFG